MSEWKTYRLGEICKFYYGKALPAIQRIPGDIPVYSSAGITGWHNKALSNGPAIIIGRKGTVGSVFYTSVPFFCIDTTYYILSDDTLYDIKFLYYLLKSLKLELLNEDSVVPGLNRETAYNQHVLLPPLDVQRKIAGILGALDDKIELNRRINANLEEQAHALFKSWFVTDKNKKLQYYEIGDVASITAGGDKPSVYSKELTEQCKIPIYSNGIESEGLYGYTDLAKIKDASITISARGTIGYVCLRKKPYFPIVRLISVTPNNVELSAEFLYLWALTQNISGTGTTQQQLTVPDFRKTLIGIPKEKTLKKFNNIVIPIFQKIEMNKEENEKLSTLRDTLLPKLMKGELKE